MSEAAFKRLLEANSFFESDRKEAAVHAYREVLRLEPTAKQRQVVENQLRVLGVMPTSSRETGRGVPSRRRRVRSATRSTGQAPFTRSFHRAQAKPPASSQSPHPAMSTAFHSPQQAKETFASRPPHKTKVHASKPLCGEKKDRVTTTTKPSPRVGVPKPPKDKSFVSEVGERPLSILDFRAVTVPTEKPSSKAISKKAAPKKPRVRHRLMKKPVQRKEESDAAFSERMARYETYCKYDALYPGIDVNVALRLEEEGISLKEYHNRKLSKKKEERARQRMRLAERAAHNQSLAGAKFLEALIRTQRSIWMLTRELQEFKGLLLKNDVFLCQLKFYRKRRKRVPKLAMQLIAEKAKRHLVKQAMRSECCSWEELQNLQSVGSSTPEELDDAQLAVYLSSSQKLCLRLESGLWIEGYLTWVDEYHLGLRVKLENSASEGPEVLIFRHAVTKLKKRRPQGWKSWTAVDALPFSLPAFESSPSR